MNEIVLVIDAERLHRDLLEALLAKKGYRVLVASTAEEALSLAERTSPELVILDEDRLDRRAWELLPLLRRTLGGTLRVLLRSSGEPWRLRQLADRCQADDWVHKLDSNRILLACVSRLTGTPPDHGLTPEPVTGLLGGRAGSAVGFDH